MMRVCMRGTLRSRRRRRPVKWTLRTAAMTATWPGPPWRHHAGSGRVRRRSVLPAAHEGHPPGADFIDGRRRRSRGRRRLDDDVQLLAAAAAPGPAARPRLHRQPAQRRQPRRAAQPRHHARAQLCRSATLRLHPLALPQGHRHQGIPHDLRRGTSDHTCCYLYDLLYAALSTDCLRRRCKNR